MARVRPVLQVGLTGGIASGKTTVATRLRSLGAHVVDADRVAHELLAGDAAARDAVVGRFGREVLKPDGGIDRTRLGARVFGDKTDRDALNAILHPRIREAFAREKLRCGEEGGSGIVIYDAALLVETGAHREMDVLVVVACSPEKQRLRLRARDGLDAREARSRIAAQAPLQHKLDLADYVIDTNGTLEQTERQTDRVWQALMQRRDSGSESVSRP